jgi:hypothetical protein
MMPAAPSGIPHEAEARQMSAATPDTWPDSTAVRVALWRALRLEVDAPPHVFADEIGLKLAAPYDGWRNAPT